MKAGDRKCPSCQGIKVDHPVCEACHGTGSAGPENGGGVCAKCEGTGDNENELTCRECGYEWEV